MDSFECHSVQSERLFPNSTPVEQVVPLSLIDATTSDFASTGAVWLFERPDKAPDFNLRGHLRQSLASTLNAYPQWTGLLNSISTLDAKPEDETPNFEPHARRFGRVYAHFGTANDPGVELILAKSTASLEDICPASRTTEQPLLDCLKTPLDKLAPSTRLANAQQPNTPDASGVQSPVFALQMTEFACGGFALAGRIAHPLADIQSFVHFIKDWAKLSRCILSGPGKPTPLINPVFEPWRLDAKAAGDINEKHADPAILEQVARLPLHRYDWWISAAECPWPVEVPGPFRDQENPAIGKPMPWSEWDINAPVSYYLIHLRREQVDSIWETATKGSPEDAGAGRISRHDAILAHIWTCITRARNQQDDSALVHCDLTYGTRPVLELGDSFIGSPTMMINIEMTGFEVASSTIPEGKRQHAVAQGIRKTIGRMSQPAAVAAHIHSIAYEKSPQRIWQTFLGQRHLLVTSWARAGVYEVDFGLSTSPVRYAESVMPNMDGLVVIKDAPPMSKPQGSGTQAWTEHGVDVSIHIRTEDMQRLIRDPLLLP
ncbi:transferase family protein [Penicillium capsulatum]|uniref:Transferase family protein n=1 Tax=Penicillium capsulatum TaxID=69766 RepID=A0A9W9LQZ9_9EURO|nr:transferase family protein [Penicillium capsulatum]KAJ6135624.1 transferase family protein [Penicillium capsulatum]